jgi:hypothetical protein
MAIAPPPIGQPPVDEPPPTTVEERMVSVNKHFRILMEFSAALAELTKMSHISAAESVPMRNVDSMLKMTEEQYQEVMEVLGGTISKVLEIQGDMNKLITIMLRISGRPMPPMPGRR